MVLASLDQASGLAPSPTAPKHLKRKRVSAHLSIRDSFRARSSSIEFLLAEVRSAFDPNSRAIHVWHQLLLAALLYEVVMLPFIAIFRRHNKQWAHELLGVYACELLFLVDFYIEFNMGYYEDGNVMMDASKSRIKYLNSRRFRLDVVALLPLSLTCFAVAHPPCEPVFFEFHKLLRLWRVPKYVAVLDDVYARHYVVLKMFKVLLVTLLLSHNVACFRFLFGYDEHRNDHWLPREPKSMEEIADHSPYLMSLFWAFGVLTGLFEGELPSTTFEFLFTIFVALCGFSLFTYVCATFFMISKCENGHLATSEARINQLKHLLSFHRVPDALQTQAVDYLKRFYTHSESNDREAVKLLCPSIVMDIQVELLKGVVGGIPFFKDCNHQFIIAVTSLLEMISLPASTIVFNAGDEGDAMYVVNSGVLHVLVKGIKIREVRKGAFFGEMALFLRRPRYATVVTTTYCTLYKLVRFHIERLFEGYPEYATLIPQRVEDMARALFGRLSGEAMLIPDQTLVSEGNEGKHGEGKKRFANLIRKHAKNGTNKVAPVETIVAVATLVDSSNSSMSPLPALAAAAPAQQESRASAEYPEGRKSHAEVPISAAENGLRQSKSDLTVSTRPPSEAAPLPPSNSVGDSRQNSPKLPLVLNDFYNQIGWSPSRVKRRYWWSNMLLATAIDSETKRRMWWLVLLQVILVYNWLLIPMQLAFLAFRRNTWIIITLNVVTDLLLWADLYVNLNMTFIEDSEKIWDTTRTAIRYFKSWLGFDLLCVFPYWLFAQSAHHALPRIPRLLRVIRLRGQLLEIDDFVKFTSKQRLLLFGMLLVVLYHIVACLHFSISYLEGFSQAYNSWIPSDDIYLAAVNTSHFVDKNMRLNRDDDPYVRSLGMKQYFRSLYYAANVLTALGLTIEPASDIQYSVALLFMLSGFFITATVVDNVQKRFTASAFEQKEFFATRSRIQLFLRRQNAPLVIHKRVNAFLDYWWSSHRGAVINELLEELPETIKQEVLQNICQPVLQTLALLKGVRPVLSELERVFLDNARFILYGQGETIYRQGDFANGLFFLLSGEISILANGAVPRSIHQGGFFGTAALDLDGNAVSYAECVTATSGSMVLFVSRQHIRAMSGAYASLVSSLRALEKRLLDPKLVKASHLPIGSGGGSNMGRRGSGILLQWIARFDRVFDPDSWHMLAWETWLFLFMTLEWILIMFHICFDVSEHHTAVNDSVLMLIELHFVVDIYVRSHLGYAEFGNKVMITKNIRQRYFRSRGFVVDVIAIVPLFMVNWGLPPSARNEALNINKLLRLSKVPTQFMALENKYIKRTLELRLFKLVYYTFLLTHIFGCVWFDFASNASGIHSFISDETDNATFVSPFGAFPWMPPASLENASSSLQYFASLFWSFGLMSESSTGDLPKTVAQSICNIVTMTSGFFLFAYVIGNFSDIIELMDAENREFYAQLNSLRHLISHFMLPEPIAAKFKNYFFFKRFHSISQEHILERCLPPSLLTDIRMVHLQPMIAKVTFLAGMDASVTRMLVAQFSQELVVKDEFVYKFGEKGSDMYFVFTGVLFTLLPSEEFARESSVIERKSSLLATKASSSNGVVPSVGRVPRLKPIAPRLIPMPTLRNAAQLTKLNEITAGSYFGENALFFNSARTSFVQANTSCILYSLSRQSLELVFDRYPLWKEKVLRIVTINQEQQRLNRLAFEEEHTDALTSVMAQVEQVSAMAERREVDPFVLRREKFASGRWRATRTVVAEGLERHQNTESLLTKFVRIRNGLREALRGITAQSRYHLIWLKLLSAATIYMSVIVPYRISFDSLMRSGWIPAICIDLELVCEFLFLCDIWVNWHLKGSHDSMELYEQDHRRSYVKERLFWDVIAAFPLDYLLHRSPASPWYRINRCVKMTNLVHYMHEVNRRSISNEMKRLRIACLVYIMLIYWTACSYFAIATYDHYGTEWSAWRPSSTLQVTDEDNPTAKLQTLRLLRGLFYGTTAFVKKGKTFTPDTTPHLVFTIVSSFIGLVVMAFMIGEIASLFISYIRNEVEYRKNYIAVELYLDRWRIHGELKARTHAYLSSLWSSHRGVDYQSLMEEVPSSVRMESVLKIAHFPLKGFTGNVFRPIGQGSASEAQQAANLDSLKQGLAQRLKFEGYPRGERVLVEGSISKAMYFVVRGHLRSTSRSHSTSLGQLSYAKGDYFGDSGLLGYSVSACTVTTMRACDLLSLSSEALLSVLHAHPTYSLALKIADRASSKMKQIPLAADILVMEVRWGQMLIDAVNEERELCDQPTTDTMARRRMKKTRAALDRLFVTRTANECYASFRPFLQLIVPNGFIHLHGAPRNLVKQLSFDTVIGTNKSTGAFQLPAVVHSGAGSRSLPYPTQPSTELRASVPKVTKDHVTASSSQRCARSARSTGRVASVREHDEGGGPQEHLESLLNRTVDAFDRATTYSPTGDVDMERMRRGTIGHVGTTVSPRSVRSGRSPTPSMHRRSVM